MCACDETGPCPRCRAEDQWWLKVERGEDEELERLIEADQRLTESKDVNK